MWVDVRGTRFLALHQQSCCPSPLGNAFVNLGGDFFDEARERPRVGVRGRDEGDEAEIESEMGQRVGPVVRRSDYCASVAGPTAAFVKAPATL